MAFVYVCSVWENNGSTLNKICEKGRRLEEGKWRKQERKGRRQRRKGKEKGVLVLSVISMLIFVSVYTYVFIMNNKIYFLVCIMEYSIFVCTAVNIFFIPVYITINILINAAAHIFIISYDSHFPFLLKIHNYEKCLVWTPLYNRISFTTWNKGAKL